ncbi:MAG: ribbon-helix-helix domain-containing protein [Chloroflexi bacterium]|nr:ribbon-helix-helix domain-containing protein [Chloroflexota bacterium]
MYNVMYTIRPAGGKTMGTKVRKQVYIEQDQDRLLSRLSAETGLSEAEIIRQAIDRHTRGAPLLRRDLAVWQEERAFIQQLIHQGRVPGHRTWQREELHER